MSFFVYGDSFNKALHNLEKVLIRCKESNVALSHKNVRCCQKRAFFLGIMSLLHVLKWTLTKIKVIMDFFSPHSPKEVRIFLGHVGYYRRFIEKFTKIVSPIYKLLAKDTTFLLDSQCQIAFEILKEKLSTTPVLRGPNWSLPFHICTDASNTTLGDVLG
jgi:hypothetical protein